MPYKNIEDRKIYSGNYNRQYYINHKEFLKQYNKQYHKDHPRDRPEYNKQWYIKNHKQKLKCNKQWYIENRKRRTERIERWRAENSEKVREINRKHKSKRRRDLNFIPLNKYFEGSAAHHINRTYIIYMPKESHQNIPHCLESGQRYVRDK